MLAIEIDGMSHDNEEAYLKDQERQSRLESFGVRFIRFTEAEVKYDILNVTRTLEAEIILIIKGDPALKLPKAFDRGLLA